MLKKEKYGKKSKIKKIKENNFCYSNFIINRCWCGGYFAYKNIIENQKQTKTIDDGKKDKNIPSKKIEENSQISQTERNKLTSLQKNETIYVRPPFGAKFLIKANNKDLSVVFDHFDSPDKRKKDKYKEKSPSFSLVDSNTKKSDLNKQGAQEVSEFLGIENLLKYYRDEFKSSLTIFGGDTNIKNENYYLARKFSDEIESTLDKNLKFKGYGEKYLTSLGTKGNYSNQYDKMFFINNDKENFGIDTIKGDTVKEYKIDIYKTFKYFIEKDILKRLNDFKESKNDNLTIRNRISDHAPVFSDVNLKNVTKIENIKVDSTLLQGYEGLRKSDKTLRIAHWNILNYNGGKAKSLAIANIIYKSGFDLVGLTEINDKAGETVKEIVDNLNTLDNSQRFKFIVQNREDTIIPQFLIDQQRFGKDQTEQVAIIYDSKNFEFKESKSYTKLIKYFVD
ncbi:hypothetical protein [Mycoplasma miroungirhinis]|uniref:Endonuclease/exonuclease/phosphatase family protein n=1 Tax=Mycoplasma miroungirhinis TaxID=754516 RepID=A0A6M4JBG3_9MOLU|nr:hypothetical protein [Mycoplasma miroungirhinis]QJR44343.1 hypothetical protein HLA92_02795 [Mycoplasma miroungirhinis]